MAASALQTVHESKSVAAGQACEAADAQSDRPCFGSRQQALSERWREHADTDENDSVYADETAAVLPSFAQMAAVQGLQPAGGPQLGSGSQLSWLGPSLVQGRHQLGSSDRHLWTLDPLLAKTRRNALA